MSMKTVARTFALLSLVWLPNYAQESRGTIGGRVVDPTGAAIAGAEVRATNRETGAAASARTNDAGNYTIPYLTPGVYDMSAAFSGFKRTEKAGVEVRVNDVLSVELHLEVGNVTETMEVKGGTPLLEVSNVSLGQVQTQRNIDDLPVQAGNANELFLLTPGVTNRPNLPPGKSS